MTDVTSTTFGLLIAYLLPGLTAFYGASYWSKTIRELFTQFVVAESNGGRFLLVVLVSLVVGLELSAVRWAIFEKWICRRDCLTADQFAALREEAHLGAFRAATDELYRYHQFFGGMAVVIPIYVIAYIRASVLAFTTVAIATALIGVWALTCVAARVSWTNYVHRSRSILTGD